MTCVAGIIEEDGTIYIGGDSASISPDGFKEVLVYRKVFYNDPFLIGFCGSYKIAQVLQYQFIPPKQHKEQDIDKYIYNDFINAIQKCLYKYIDNDKCFDGKLMIGYKNKLFKIDPDFHIIETKENYTAIGLGSFVALGSLYSTKDINNAELRINLALEASAYFTNVVAPPFYVMKL
jgi:20S proteasome alpha/beta subunit